MSAPIAIVAAMREELDALLAIYPAYKALAHFNTDLFQTHHGQQELVIAQSGVGKVNAACTLALLLSDFEPRCVINIGCAGGLHTDQNVLDLVIPEEIVYTDVDVTPLGMAYGQMLGSPARFKAAPELLSAFRALDRQQALNAPCDYGMLGSADAFIHQSAQVDLIRRRFDNQVRCVDMEGAAIAQVCTRFGVPFLILRALSDVPGKGQNTSDFKTFLNRAAANSAALCRRLVEALA